MNFDTKLDQLYIDLPEPPPTMGAVAHVVRAGKLLFVSGVLPRAEGGKIMTGRAGVEVRLDAAKAAAHASTVMALAMLAQELGGSLTSIKRIVQISLAVACGADFKDHLKVADATGELLQQIFGAAGKSARSAIGATSLPEGATVELSMIVEIK